MVLFCYRASAVWGSGSSSLYTQLKELAVDGFRELTSFYGSGEQFTVYSAEGTSSGLFFIELTTVSDPDPVDP